MTAPDDQALSFGQRRDPRTGLVQPWLTHGALDEIVALPNLGGTDVLEWGGGFSTLWWALECRSVVTVESNPVWCDWLAERLPSNVWLHHETDPMRYAELPLVLQQHFGIVVVDGLDRTRCIEAALRLPRPLVLVVDNWQQDDVYVCHVAEKMMRPYAGRFHVQADHTNHRGRPWQTAMWDLV